MSRGDFLGFSNVPDEPAGHVREDSPRLASNRNTWDELEADRLRALLEATDDPEYAAAIQDMLDQRAHELSPLTRKGALRFVDGEFIRPESDDGDIVRTRNRGELLERLKLK